ncbi:hypothetical protein ACIBQX_11395 [Nonomuraea sp. NPDC049714]|uniref:hypothetical protein n=1 Tax=Nonomuraea sp. NPDC049714 TaxID=3364357 RepID=UPI0037A4F9A6
MSNFVGDGSEVRVTFAINLRTADAPTADELATGGHLPGELVFTRDDSVSCELPSRTRRFLVARWPDGLTKVREVFMSEAER